jgi:hypothetical protein
MGQSKRAEVGHSSRAPRDIEHQHAAYLIGCRQHALHIREMTPGCRASHAIPLVQFLARVLIESSGFDQLRQPALADHVHELHFANTRAAQSPGAQSSNPSTL